MKKSNLWIERLKERLDEYDCQAPDGVWDRLEDELDGKPKPAKRGFSKWQRFVGITVALLIALSAVAAAIYYTPEKNIENADGASVQTSVIEVSE